MSTARKFDAKPAVLEEVPLLIGLIGPPGGGKSYSALRLAAGMRQVRPGPVVAIDTERGRLTKYARDFDFLHVDFLAPFRPIDFLDAVKAQLRHKPAAIIIDSLSDEHEGDGGVLDWHDREVPNVSGNTWAAWAKPKASRRAMISGFLQIKVPLIFTFRAREKTKMVRDERSGRDVPMSVGYQAIAPAEVIYALDLTCILPPRANGVPVWKSDKIGEDFIIKLPKYLAHAFAEGHELDEKTGAALASWAQGNIQSSGGGSGVGGHDHSRPASEEAQAPQGGEHYIARWQGLIDAATSFEALAAMWKEESAIRKSIMFDPNDFDTLKKTVTKAIEFLRDQEKGPEA